MIKKVYYVLQKYRVLSKVFLHSDYKWNMKSRNKFKFIQRYKYTHRKDY